MEQLIAILREVRDPRNFDADLLVDPSVSCCVLAYRFTAHKSLDSSIKQNVSRGAN